MSEKQPGQDHVEALLKGAGFSVQGITGTPDLQHADLYAERDGTRTVIEIKARLDDPIFKALLPALNRDGSAMYTAGSGKTNAFSGKVKEAANQLQASATDTDFRCLWFIIGKQQFAEVGDQIQGTILGRRFLLGGKEDDADGTANSEPCYVLARADLYRFPEIDGVIIDYLDRGSLIVNPASPRYARLKNWPLWKDFNSHGAVRDIVAEEAAKEAYVIPLGTEIKSDQDILDFVRQKYGLSGFLAFWDPMTIGGVTQVKKRAP